MSEITVITAVSGRSFRVSASEIHADCGIVFSRSEVAKAISLRADHMRCCCGLPGCSFSAAISRNDDGSVQVACSKFSELEVARISQWAKAGSQ